MKPLKQYLQENKKIYSFKIKVAGELPENFEKSLKMELDRCKIAVFEKMASTPIQSVPLDFPNLTNKEVTIYDLVCEYPITSPEISEMIKNIGLKEECFRVRGSSEPTEFEQMRLDDETSLVILSDPFYKESVNAKHKDYFGDGFNKNFLKELSKTAKERKKELGQDRKDPDVLGSAPAIKQDRAGEKSAIGS
jgi:hypothetical protein